MTPFVWFVTLLGGLGVTGAAAWRWLRLRRAWFILRRQWEWSLRRAPRSALVLEVGSGHNPQMRADVLCEKYLMDDTHRAAAAVIDRTLVVGDAEALPFRDGAFDVILSSHMIEHLDEPKKFFAESGRVAGRGLFTAPSSHRERILGDPQHLWYIDAQNEDDHLLFRAKERAVHDGSIQDFFARHVVPDRRRFDRFILDHWAELEIEYDWEGEPRVVVEGTPPSGGFVTASVDESAPTIRREVTGVEAVRHALRGFVRRMLHRLVSSPKTIRWEELLACPSCAGEVMLGDAALLCHRCGVQYPIRDGIPFMLIEASEPIGLSTVGQDG